MGTALHLETCESTREGVTLTPRGTMIVELTAAELIFRTPGELPWGLVGCKLKSVMGLGSEPAPNVGLEVGGSMSASVVGLGASVGAGPANIALHRSLKQHPTRQSKDLVQKSNFR